MLLQVQSNVPTVAQRPETDVNFWSNLVIFKKNYFLYFLKFGQILSSSDFDECMHNQDLCQNGQCLNSPGGYHCDCDVGFIGNEDRDRCDGESPCYM